MEADERDTMDWDIRHDIAEIPTKRDEVKFTFDLALAHKVKELRAGDDEKALAEAEKALEAKTYRAELVAVPRRQRQDIYEKSLEEYPSSVLTGRPDEKTMFKRNNYVRVQLIAAGVVRIHRPTGEVQEEDILEAIQMIHDEAPDQIFETIENKVNELNEAQDEQDALHKDADF